MYLYCIKFLKFTNNNDIKIKRETDAKIIIYFYHNNYGFKTFETADKE